jgi:hypothetical protein
MAMAMAMAMISSEQKPPPMPPTHDHAHSLIGDFSKITVSNSDNDLHLVRFASGWLDGWMLDIPEVEIWRTVSLWMFLLSLLFCLLLYFIGSRPSTNGVSMGFNHLQRKVKWRWGFPACQMRRMASIGYWMVVGLMGSYVCVRWTVIWLFASVSTLVWDHAAQGVYT